MGELHCFSMQDTDTVVARDIDDAWLAWAEYSGYVEPAKVRADYDAEDMEQLDDAKVIKIWCDAKGDPCEIGDGTKTEKPAAEWAKRGRGFLCTTEN